MMDTPIPGPQTLEERQFVRAVGDLAGAEQREAEAFLARKHEVKPPRSDWEARSMAVLDTQSAVTLTRGQYEIALNRMKRITDADQR